MREIKPGVPDYLPQLAEALRKRGISEAVIDVYRRRWNALRPDAPALPCPFCFIRGNYGNLEALGKKGGNSYVGCSHCGEQILVHADGK